MILPPSIQVVPFVPWHLSALKMRPNDLISVESLDLAEVARTLALTSSAETALLHRKPVACFGFSEISKGVLACWMVCDIAVNRVQVALTKTGREVFQRAISSPHCHRIEATVLEGNESAGRWLEFFGFELEGPRRRFFPNGHDGWLYGKVK